MAILSDLIKVFGMSLLLLLTKVFIKYVIKASYLATSSETDADERAAVHFECLRVGVDLALIGLVSYLTILEIATLHGQPVAFGTFHKFAIVLQVFSLVASIFFTQMFDSATKSFKSGILVPMAFGWLSVWTSAWAFVAAIAPHD